MKKRLKTLSGLERVIIQEAQDGSSLPDRAGIGIAAGLAVFCLILLFLHVVTHFPYFDEAIHAHFLWLISVGQRPEVDFFCTYPALAYFLTLPYLKLFPESAYTLLALRCLSVALACLAALLFARHGRRFARYWPMGLLPFLLIGSMSRFGDFFAEYSIDHFAALAALGAMTLFFSRFSLPVVASAGALALLSVLITPKYSLPVAFGLLGLLLSPGVRSGRGWRTLGAVFCGCAAALLFAVLLYRVHDASVADNFRLSHMLVSRWNLSQDKPGFPVAASVANALVSEPALAILLGLGLAGWVKRSWMEQAPERYPGWGILLGTAVHCILVRSNLEQYVVVPLMCLAFFVPFASSLFGSPIPSRALRLALVVGAAVAIVPRLLPVAEEFRETPMFSRGIPPWPKPYAPAFEMAPPVPEVLREYSEWLRRIPGGERVVAVWPYHPVFRRDATFITWDDRPSFRDLLDAEDPARREFEPARFLEALERTPPALIVLDRLQLNYPPGWQEACAGFLDRHPRSYVRMVIGGRAEAYLRGDLLPGVKKE